ncbi:hypothetical protein OAG89_03055 [Pseudomonadales bacterium]|nr:hypothetical protein [Pseudomonadales bacterium]
MFYEKMLPDTPNSTLSGAILANQKENHPTHNRSQRKISAYCPIDHYAGLN